MSNTEKIGCLLRDIQTLKEAVSKIQDAEIYPVSFFSQTFELTHKILTDLHSMETEQIEILRRQMEEHRAILRSMPEQIATPQPVFTEPIISRERPEPVKPFIEPVIQDKTEEYSPAKEHISVESESSLSYFEKPKVSLNEVLEKKSLSDFRKAFSLNDRFYFRRELFGGDEERMNRAIADLNEVESFEESLLYLNDQLKWNLEDQHVENFIRLLEKRFH